MTVAELKKIIEKNEWDEKYEKFGIRVQTVPFRLGVVDHCSKVWIDNEETDEELDGICATDLDQPEAAKTIEGRGYFGDYIALIGSSTYSYGQDLGEIILEKDAEVLYIIK